MTNEQEDDFDRQWGFFLAEWDGFKHGTDKREIAKLFYEAGIESVQAIRDQEAAKVAMLVEALNGVLKAHRITVSKFAPDTVEQAERQLDAIQSAVKNAQEALSTTAPEAEAFIREKQAEALEDAAEVFSTIGHSKFKTPSEELRRMAAERSNAKEV